MEGFQIVNKREGPYLGVLSKGRIDGENQALGLKLSPESARADGLLFSCGGKQQSLHACYWPSQVPRVLHILIEPGDHFIERVFDRLTRRVGVSFVRQHDEARGPAVAADRLIHAL